MSENNESVSDNLIGTIARLGALELPAEILEFSIDQVIDDGLLKDIPFVGWIAKGLSWGTSISDRIFHRKVVGFLVALDNIDTLDREIFRTKLENDWSFKRKVGEQLIIIIDKIDAFDKTSLLAEVFDHFLTEDIDYEHFVDLSHVISSASLSDLKAIAVPDNKRIVFASAGAAAGSGILEYGLVEKHSTSETPEIGTRLSDYGRDLRDMFLHRFRDRKAKESSRMKELRRHLKENRNKS